MIKSHQWLGVVTVIYIMWLGLYGILVELTEAGWQNLQWYCIIVDEWHIHDCGSHHPQRIISPFASTSMPCYWKKMVHPASHSSLMVSRLCFKYLKRKILHAVGGSLANWRHTVVFVCMISPLGLMREKFGSWSLATLAGAPCCTSNVNAAESMKVVVPKFVRLAQLGWLFQC